MVKRLRLLLAAIMFVMAAAVNAQVTTSSMSGTVTGSQKEAIIGATVRAVHEPSGTSYSAVTNVDGRFNIQGMRVGGPYKVTITYIGYEPKTYEGIQLNLAENYVLNANVAESAELLDEVVVTGAKDSNMKYDRAGAVTNIGSAQIATMPTVSRSMNDIMRLTPQGGDTGNGFAVGGGNFRQSYVTVDGAAFNNAFGIGSNLPAGGSPISLDALEQISVSITPYDVRQSGFTGAAINAVTKSGTNTFKGTAYTYLTSQNMKGNKVGDLELNREKSHYYTYGASIGGPIIKDKLFFFVNGEYEDNTTAGPTAKARQSETDEWGNNTANVHRPTVADMEMIKDYLIKNYNYNPGRYQNYSIETPAYKLLARLDWNINNNNRLNFRFSKTHMKDSNSPSSSTSPLLASEIYPGGNGIAAGTGNKTANTGLYFESSRYYQEQDFTSFAGEWNSRWLDGALNNVLRLTYSYQDEPRTYEGGAFPSVDILKDGAVYATFGPDVFTAGNLRQVKTWVATDEVSWLVGKHNLFAGLQFEHNDAANGFMQAGNGYYVFSSWDDFVNGNKPAAFGITHSNSKDLSQFIAKMKSINWSFYLQDQMALSDRFKLTAGLRFELPVYPDLNNNYNPETAKLSYFGKHYSTDQLPSARISVSPRVGFNWDLTGERKYVLRGGTGIFVGRLPFVWLVSAVGNSGVGQTSYYYNNVGEATGNQPSFHGNVNDILQDLYNGNFTPNKVLAASQPTFIDTDLKMPSTWKTSLAFDAKLPYDIDFSIEGIYNKDINPAVFHNNNYYISGIQTLSPNDVRYKYSAFNGANNAYYITNGGKDAYYFSLTASLAKRFDFGLNLSAAYTYSRAKAYNDGLGSQVTSAYKTNTYSVNGINGDETGYATYVTPNRLVVSASYKVDYLKSMSSTFGLIYEGMNMGYNGGYASTRYSYTFSGNVVGDRGANNLLYIPASREELNDWTFKDYTDKQGNVTYSADQQKDDFWAYINQDDYLKDRKGKYTERGGATMPWHHQLDFKFNQDFYIKAGKTRNTLQFGIDIKNLLNLLNSDWGLYKQVNNASLLSYRNGAYQFQQNDGKALKDTYSKFASFNSTYSIQFSIRYIFN